MPVIDVTYQPGSVTESELRLLVDVLPDVVSEAVDCPEEPWVGPLAAGDMNIFFRPIGPLDVTDLDCIVEVRTKLFASRVADKNERALMITERVADCLDGRSVGVWLVLGEGAWGQT
jgi:hypothetical protein